MDLCEFKASLVYRVSYKSASIATEKPCLEKQKRKKSKLSINSMFISVFMNLLLTQPHHPAPTSVAFIRGAC